MTNFIVVAFVGFFSGNSTVRSNTALLAAAAPQKKNEYIIDKYDMEREPVSEELIRP